MHTIYLFLWADRRHEHTKDQKYFICRIRLLIFDANTRINEILKAKQRNFKILSEHTNFGIDHFSCWRVSKLRAVVLLLSYLCVFVQKVERRTYDK